MTLKARSAPSSVSSASALRAASMKRLDCSGSSGLDRVAFDIDFGAFATGPSFLCPSFRMSAHRGEALMRKPQRPFATVRTGIGRGALKCIFKCCYALLQRGYPLSQFPQIGGSPLDPIKGFLSGMSLNRCHHG